MKLLCSTVVATDVTKLEDIKALIAATIAAYGQLDILFNNAGWEGPTFPPDPAGFPSIDDEVLLQINQVNMMAPVYCAKYAIAEMQKSGGGVVIGNASIAGAMPINFAGMCPVRSKHHLLPPVFPELFSLAVSLTHVAPLLVVLSGSLPIRSTALQKAVSAVLAFCFCSTF